MTFYSNFSDINGKRYEIEIYSSSGSGEVNLTMGGTPVVITSASEGLFSPIKSRSATLEIVTTQWYFDLYEPSSRGTTVKIYEYDSTKPYNQGTVIFRGYLTPCSYNQDFTYLDTIQLEAIDCISTAKDYKWINNGTYKTFFDIVINIIKSSGYQGVLYVPETYTKINNTDITGDVLDKLYASSSNFIDDNEEKTPWTQYEVLEEVLKFLGWSLCPDGDDIWLVDYRAENSDSVTYYEYDIQTTSKILDGNNNPVTYISDDTPTLITLDETASGTSQISIDDIYNKIEVNDNLYQIDEISPDIFDDGTHISVTDEEDLGADKSKWSTVRRRKFLWWEWDDKKEYLEGTDYQTLCRLKPESGWVHKYYRMSDGSYIGRSDDPLYEKGYFDQQTADNPNQRAWTGSRTIQKVNTQCCLLQHYAYVDESHPNNVPATIDWSNILTFFVLGPSTVPFPLGQFKQRIEKPVLEYNVGEIIQWRPSSGISWITIKCSLFYQAKCEYEDGKKTKILTLINQDEGWYATTPIDKSLSSVPNDINLGGSYAQRSPSNPDYGKGFELWKMGIHIGGKSWNGKKWVDDPNETTTFYLSFNNNPDNENNEYIPAFEWINVVSNTTYKDQVGEDCYAIPIPSQQVVNDDTQGKYTGWDIPSFGNLKLVIYCPLVAPQELLDIYAQYWGAAQCGFNTSACPVIYCKDFELGYVYTDTNVWWNNHKEDNKKDKVYIGWINQEFVNDFDGLEFKLNTSLKDKPIARSFVSTSNDYLATMKHVVGDEPKAQEYNIIDLYLDHYGGMKPNGSPDRKVIFEHSMHELFKPNKVFSKSQFEGNLMIDSQSYDIANNNNRIKFIAF